MFTSEVDPLLITFYVLIQRSRRHVNKSTRNLHNFFVDQDAEQWKMRVNYVAIVGYYRIYACHDNFVKTSIHCPTKRGWSVELVFNLIYGCLFIATSHNVQLLCDFYFDNDREKSYINLWFYQKKYVIFNTIIMTINNKN